MATKKSIAKSIIERFAKEYEWADKIEKITILSGGGGERLRYFISLEFSNNNEVGYQELKEREEILTHFFDEIQDRADRLFLDDRRETDRYTISGENIIDNLKTFVHSHIW